MVSEENDYYVYRMHANAINKAYIFNIFVNCHDVYNLFWNVLSVVLWRVGWQGVYQ